MIVCSTKGAIQAEKTKKTSRLTRFQWSRRDSNLAGNQGLASLNLQMLVKMLVNGAKKKPMPHSPTRLVFY